MTFSSKKRVRILDYSKKNVKFGLLLKIWDFPETEDIMSINNQTVLDRNTECAVIGYGSWATAIVKVLCENENTVHWNIRNPDIIESVTKYGYNCKYVRDAELDRSRLHVSPDINEVIEKAGIVFLAMPSAFIKTFFEKKASKSLPGRKKVIPLQPQTRSNGVIRPALRSEEEVIEKFTYQAASVRIQRKTNRQGLEEKTEE